MRRAVRRARTAGEGLSSLAELELEGALNPSLLVDAFGEDRSPLAGMGGDGDGLGGGGGGDGGEGGGLTDGEEEDHDGEDEDDGEDDEEVDGEDEEGFGEDEDEAEFARHLQREARREAYRAARATHHARGRGSSTSAPSQLTPSDGWLTDQAAGSLPVRRAREK